MVVLIVDAEDEVVTVAVIGMLSKLMVATIDGNAVAGSVGILIHICFLNTLAENG